MHHLSRQTLTRESHRLAGIDARVKVLTGFALLVMVIGSHGIVFPLFVSIVSLALCLSLGVSARLLLLRFSEPLFIALTLLLLKAFFAGSAPLFSLHVAGLELVAHRDGLLEGVRIAARIVGGASLLAAVGFSTPFTDLLAALGWLRIPQALIDVALFAWRYLFLLLDDAQVVYNAQRNRLGYVGYRRGLKSFGTLAGVLVIKAFDNSQSVTTAMMQRGYDGEMPLLLQKPLRIAEVVSALVVVSGMAAILALT